MKKKKKKKNGNTTRTAVIIIMILILVGAGLAGVISHYVPKNEPTKTPVTTLAPDPESPSEPATDDPFYDGAKEIINGSTKEPETKPAHSEPETTMTPVTNTESVTPTEVETKPVPVPGTETGTET